MLGTSPRTGMPIFEDIFEGGRCNSLGEATPEYRQCFPNVRNMMLVGALLGMALAAGAILIVYLVDNRVKDEADFVSKIGIPVLGEVPSIHELDGGKEGYGYYADYQNAERIASAAFKDIADEVGGHIHHRVANQRRHLGVAAFYRNLNNLSVVDNRSGQFVGVKIVEVKLRVVRQSRAKFLRRTRAGHNHAISICHRLGCRQVGLGHLLDGRLH